MIRTAPMKKARVRERFQKRLSTDTFYNRFRYFALIRPRLVYRNSDLRSSRRSRVILLPTGREKAPRCRNHSKGVRDRVVNLLAQIPQRPNLLGLHYLPGWFPGRPVKTPTPGSCRVKNLSSVTEKKFAICLSSLSTHAPM